MTEVLKCALCLPPHLNVNSMKISNIKDSPVIGKIYWQFSMGFNVPSHRFYEGGWRAVEFVVFRPYEAPNKNGDAHPYLFRLGFAYWLPFMPL